jgi:hypothetical protein
MRIEFNVAMCHGFISMYVKSLKIEEGRDVFENMNGGNVVFGTQMVVEYVQTREH